MINLLIILIDYFMLAYYGPNTVYKVFIIIFLNFKYHWMYFATLLKTTAPVKLPVSQLSLYFCNIR